ncbi:MAG: extracellular solute-binding protein [Eubacteriales bacterium]|nr:extracellular solute-binding protein [Eubacteriales bacterium]
MALCAAAAICLAGCSGQQEGAADTNKKTENADENSSAGDSQEQQHEPVTLHYYHNPADGGANESMIEMFMEEYPWITVERVEYPSDTTQKKTVLSTVFQSQDDSIDVMQLDCTWPAEFTQAGWLADLSDVYTEEEMADFISGIVDTGRGSDGNLYALPVYINTGALLYRKDLLEKYGFSGPAKTYDELIAQSKTVMEGEAKEGKRIAGYTSAWKEYEGLTCQALGFMWSYGAEFEKDGICTLNSPEAAKGLQTMRDMVEQGITDPGIRGYKWTDSQAIFNNGGALYMVDWPSAYNSAVNPENSTVSDVVGMTVVPGGTSAEASYSANGGWYLGVSAFSSHPEEAKLLARFATGYEANINYALKHSNLPARISCYDDERIKTEQPQMAEMKEAAATCKSRPASPYYSEISAEIFGTAAQIIDGNVDAQTGVSQMTERIQDILDR